MDSGYSRASADPLLAACVDLLLPQRNRLLERVDRLAAGRERCRPVRRRDGDDDARLADLYAADPVMDRDLAQPVRRGQPGRALAQAGEEAHGNRHAVDLASRRTLDKWACSSTRLTLRPSVPPTRPSAAPTCAASRASSARTGGGSRRCSP